MANPNRQFQVTDATTLQALVRTQLQAQLALLDAGTDPARIKPLRNPWME